MQVTYIRGCHEKTYKVKEQNHEFYKRRKKNQPLAVRKLPSTNQTNEIKIVNSFLPNECNQHNDSLVVCCRLLLLLVFFLFALTVTSEILFGWVCRGFLTLLAFEVGWLVDNLLRYVLFLFWGWNLLTTVAVVSVFGLIFFCFFAFF